MDTRYAFSLNGSDWTGEFNARKDARAAAMIEAHRQAETPGVVYVGKIVPAEAQASRHADVIVHEMSARAERAGVSGYLDSIKTDQLRDLDQALTKTISDWLDRNKLRPTQFSVQAISEYPVPAASAVAQPSEKEISDLGPPRQVA